MQIAAEGMSGVSSLPFSRHAAVLDPLAPKVLVEPRSHVSILDDARFGDVAAPWLVAVAAEMEKMAEQDLPVQSLQEKCAASGRASTPTELVIAAVMRTRKIRG